MNMGKQIRTEDAFVRHAVDLRRPELCAVRQAVRTGDYETAWESLIAHFRKRKHLHDPAVNQLRQDSNLLRRHPGPRKHKGSGRDEVLQQFRSKGTVDWDRGTRVNRKDYEKYWGRNRLGSLSVLTREALATGRAKQRKLVADIFLDWFDSCPTPKLPINRWTKLELDGFAWRELEVALRGRFLVTLFFATLAWTDVAPRFRRALLLSIRQSVEYLKSQFACAGFHRGNHEASHAMPRIAVGTLLPELRGASAYLRTGLSILRQHIERDHHKDGVQKEHSPSYHQMVIGIYRNPWEVLRANRKPVPKWLPQTLDKMQDFLLYATTPEGKLASINDSRPAPSESVRRHFAKVLRRPELLAVEGETPKQKLPPTSRAFRSAGLAFMRSSWDKDATYVVLDASGCGGSHWHPGKPNLIIHAGDQKLAPDPELGSYDDPTFVSYFHTGTSHNTILVDGIGDGVPNSPWHFDHTSQAKLTFFHAGKNIDIARGMTDGFRRLKPPVDVTRTVVFVKPHLLFVHDRVVSKGPHHYEWLLHLVPQKPVVDKGKKTLRTNLSGPFQLLCQPAPGMQEKLACLTVRQGYFRNQIGPDRWWNPPKRGRKPELLARAPYGVWDQKAAGTTTFDFVLQILTKRAQPCSVTNLDTSARAGTAAYCIRAGRKIVTLLFDDRSSSRRKPLVAGGFRLAGRLGVALGRELVSDGTLLRL